MELDRSLAPGPGGRPSRTPRAIEYVEPRGDSTSFSKAVAAVERNRRFVRGAVGVALIARLLLEFNLVSLLQQRANLVASVPSIGMALLAYLWVMMWMAKGSGDRLGFGMALGLGVIESAFLIVTASMQSPFSIRTAWSPIVVGIAHLPMAAFALRSASAYPANDDKQPWIMGFVVALFFLAIPWVAPAIATRIHW